MCVCVVNKNVQTFFYIFFNRFELEMKLHCDIIDLWRASYLSLNPVYKMMLKHR